jgi:hypothetical protein
MQNLRLVVGSNVRKLLRTFAIILMLIFVLSVANVVGRMEISNLHLTRTVMAFLLAIVPVCFLIPFAFGAVFKHAGIGGSLAALLMCSAALWLAYGLFQTAVDCPKLSMGARGTNWCKLDR